MVNCNGSDHDAIEIFSQHLPRGTKPSSFPDSSTKGSEGARPVSCESRPGVPQGTRVMQDAGRSRRTARLWNVGTEEMCQPYCVLDRNTFYTLIKQAFALAQWCFSPTGSRPTDRPRNIRSLLKETGHTEDSCLTDRAGRLVSSGVIRGDY